MHNTPILILASSSITRRRLLDRLDIPYQIDKPEIDERLHAGETGHAAVLRLAQEKAARVATRHPDAVIIGSDQLLECDGVIYGKPGNAEQAALQLRALSGRRVQFHVAVAVLAPQSPPGLWHEVVEACLRPLHDEDIHAYIQHEQPFDAAGSMKSEGLGITLLESMHSQDPTAILGLPLIATARLLRAAGIDPLRK